MPLRGADRSQRHRPGASARLSAGAAIEKPRMPLLLFCRSGLLKKVSRPSSQSKRMQCLFHRCRTAGARRTGRGKRTGTRTCSARGVACRAAARGGRGRHRARRSAGGRTTGPVGTGATTGRRRRGAIRRRPGAPACGGIASGQHQDACQRDGPFQHQNSPRKQEWNCMPNLHARQLIESVNSMKVPSKLSDPNHHEA